MAIEQRAIPCVLMRGGTSRGPFFAAEDLPDEPALRDAVLAAVMGSPTGRQIDGLGGGTTVTSKVAVVGPSSHPDADVDYLFAQVDPVWGTVDTKPTCGNMLVGVGPFAIEHGLVPAGDPTTSLVVRNVNTDSFIDVVCCTPGGELTFHGDYEIDGVDGTAAPVELRFRGIEGSVTGSMLPTGCVSETVSAAGVDVEATLIDVAMPMVMVRAADLGKSGHEAPSELEADADFMAAMEAIRREAGGRMGLGDVSRSVVPKFGLLSPARHGGTITSRYFTPTQCHPAHAVSGGICVAAAVAVPGTVAAALSSSSAEDAAGREVGNAADGTELIDMQIEHPSGSLAVALAIEHARGDVRILSGGVTRTARKIMSGTVHVPAEVWSR
ncbi:4-oxalomesaconate tautomerase [Candidatus Poriferisodalis multihospitum]|uniref:4-oxalomesaconate tautomerase n=1 Tax=Candidatus Poriferisodalis multihospitum TaxID=2983191 RepID=UPI00229E242F|nr:4-oxalomesaconate tautomerase [Candidatus Poriferisodalis multihospitum]MCY3586620.1 4-oxalomesaconate tautomerase [Acidimicrobiaceae bacterium]